jgi:histidinol-phosphate aminotransferase
VSGIYSMSFQRPHIEAMQGYVPGEQPQTASVIKLNTNENPYPPSPLVQEALNSIDIANLRRYPPPTAKEFRDVAAALHQVAAENIIPTNGGDELLRLVMTTFVGGNDIIAVTKPSYSLYPVLAEAQNSPLVEVELNDDWSMPEDFAKRLNTIGAKLAIVVNPHAPTGSLLTPDYLSAVATTFNGLLLVDEAYVDFIDPEKGYDSAPLIKKHDNIILLRTLSKGYSLAGLRFGYGIGPESLISPMMFKTRDSYNTDLIAQRLATAALKSVDYAATTWDKVRNSRALLTQRLEQLGLHCHPSQTNFLLTEVPTSPGAPALYEALKAQNILVRHFDQDRLRHRLRISIGTEAENTALVDALTTLLSPAK